MQHYVVGLLFAEGREVVLLIHKQHGPKCVVGKWNGVGGHVEPNEQPIKAMVREFCEETGVLTREHDWEPVAEIVSRVAHVHFLVCENTSYYADARTMTDEEVDAFLVRHLPSNLMGNLKWMIPWLADPTIIRDFLTIRMKADQEI